MIGDLKEGLYGPEVVIKESCCGSEHKIYFTEHNTVPGPPTRKQAWMRDKRSQETQEQFEFDRAKATMFSNEILVYELIDKWVDTLEIAYMRHDGYMAQIQLAKDICAILHD